MKGRLDEVCERLRALEARLDAVAAASRREPVAGATTVAIDVDSLQRALEQVEERELEALSDEELLRGARIAIKGGENLDDALRRLQVLSRA